MKIGSDCEVLWEKQTLVKGQKHLKLGLDAEAV